jgi:CheY-like chemotaxis protein
MVGHRPACICRDVIVIAKNSAHAIPAIWLDRRTSVAHFPTSIFLIVDGEVESARTLGRLLRKWGYRNVRCEHSASAALESAAGFSPDIVLLDIELPGLNSYELARVLHQHPRLQSMRLIALTHSGEHPGRERARASGFERYLVKPVTATALREILNTPSPWPHSPPHRALTHSRSDKTGP